MKQTKRPLTWLFTVIIIAGLSCDGGQDSLFDNSKISNCHRESSLNYETTRSKIVGLWEWQYIVCCPESLEPYRSETQFEGLKIEFNADGTGTMINNDTTRQFTWDIVPSENGNGLYYEFRPIIGGPLGGVILLCDDTMLCHDSYRDGADNFLKKAEARSE